MADLKIYNTLSKKIETFKSIKKNEVKMYVCGPTVNDVPHLGHARQQITFDILRRYLEFIGYKVNFVSNITDIDDKIINKANELKQDIKELTIKNTKAHLEDYEKISVRNPTVRTKATEYIKEMISLVKLLEKKGYTYIIEGDGVYYDISKFKEYGKLSHQKTKDLIMGKRVKVKQDKRNKEDFVLWKLSKPSEPSWDSPWGAGRPGWHIECSAMSHAILGLPFDIHGGGQDLIFPHHEDEIAQSEAAFGKKMANYWVHNGMVNVDSVKMSKSLGNFTTIRDLLKKYPGQVLRYFALSSNYRKQLDFSPKNIDAAKTAYERLERKIIEIKAKPLAGNDKIKEYKESFIQSMNEDLNTPGALAVVWKIIDDFDFDGKKKLSLLLELDTVLGFGIADMHESKVTVPEEVRQLVEERERLRKEKKWAESDIVRARIRERGFEVLDTPQGPQIKKSS